MKFISFINDYQGFATVVLTFIYVVSTVLIVVFNHLNNKTIKESILQAERNQEENLRVALWEKRYKVFKEISEMLIELDLSEDIEDGYIRRASDLCNQGLFLFQDDVHEKLVDIKDSMFEYLMIRTTEKRDIGRLDQEEMIKYAKEMKIFNEAHQELREVAKLMGKYLDISNYGNNDKIL